MALWRGVRDRRVGAARSGGQYWAGRRGLRDRALHLVARRAERSRSGWPGIAFTARGELDEASRAARQFRRRFAANPPRRAPLGFTLDPADVPVGGLLDGGLAVVVNDPTPPTSVDPVEAIPVNGRDDAPDMTRRQWDVVRVAAHEAHEPAVGGDGDRVTGQQGAEGCGPGRPMQRGAPFEVASTLDQGEAGEGLDDALPMLDARVGSLYPLAIRRRDVDRRRAEGATPFHADTIEMRCDIAMP